MKTQKENWMGLPLCPKGSLGCQQFPCAIARAKHWIYRILSLPWSSFCCERGTSPAPEWLKREIQSFFVCSILRGCLRFQLNQYGSNLKHNMLKGSLKVKLPTIWTVGQADVGRAGKERQKKEDPCRKVAKHCVYPILWSPGGSKSGSLKQQVPSHLWRWEMQKARSTCRCLNVQISSLSCWSTFGSSDVQKVHAKHIWKLKC